jgi:hypothetical protein
VSCRRESFGNTGYFEVKQKWCLELVEGSLGWTVEMGGKAWANQKDDAA